MPLRTAEAFILRTYPLKESDKIVSFFTREFGKLRGVARAARRPKSKFGSMLEPLTRVRIQYFEREGRDLCNIDHCELLHSMATVATGDLLQSVALACMLEVAERTLPEHEVNDAVFRLLSAALPVLRQARGSATWAPLTYYLLWMVRLGGFLPNFAEDATLPQSARELAAICASAPPHALPETAIQAASARAGCELRLRLRRSLEDHLEASLKTWPMLAELDTQLGATGSN